MKQKGFRFCEICFPVNAYVKMETCCLRIISYLEWTLCKYSHRTVLRGGCFRCLQRSLFEVYIFVIRREPTQNFHQAQPCRKNSLFYKVRELFTALFVVGICIVQTLRVEPNFRI